MKLSKLTSFEILNEKTINLINGGKTQRPSKKGDSHRCADVRDCCVIKKNADKLQKVHSHAHTHTHH
ncbi:hypothetical protein [Tenacibaculum sp. 190524A02b]|uniref:hypothetical protein n=1 Tax=Tenacibaculum vairaonense TaxID=3137860 RepID=UPI0032B27E6E